MIEAQEPRLGGAFDRRRARAARAGKIRRLVVRPVLRPGPDALAPGQRAITSFNRNWQNRMGVGGEGFLAAPPSSPASALAGYMAPPSELGLHWSAAGGWGHKPGHSPDSLTAVPERGGTILFFSQSSPDTALLRK